MEQGYFSIIPNCVLFDDELSPSAKLVYAAISSLTKKEGYCYASNSYLAELFKVNSHSISNLIQMLKTKNYIKIEYEYNGKEIKQRRIYLLETFAFSNQSSECLEEPLCNKNDIGMEEKLHTPCNKNDIGYVKNVTSNNINYKYNLKEKVNNTRACNFDTHNDVTDVQKVSTPSVTESVQMLQSCTPELETSCTFQDVVKQCFEKIQVHNQNHSVQKRVPISRDFMTFVQKEGRLLAEYLKAENPEAILKALTNYLKVADMDSWKTAFSFQAFCKNYIEYTDDYFAVEKFDKTSDPEEICQQFRNRMEQDNRFDVAEFLQHKKDWLALGRPDGEDYFIQQEKWYATDED